MNGFVAYLNSVNNVDGNSTGSLAEKQVKSAYFDKIKVDRKLGDLIAESVSARKYKVYILTGHAGDGKTSILAQVLKKLGHLSEGEGLEEERSFADFYYVKDMSELSDERQREALIKALTAPERQQTSLLISNTGPLLHAFTALQEEKNKQFGVSSAEEDQIKLQSVLLKQLDDNKDQEIEALGYKFFLINIARIDNVGFAAKILGKMIDDSVWTECQGCACRNICPILHNKQLISAQCDRVSSFVENFYRFLFENDKRMTIRQMIGQLSYAITGNLSCSDVSEFKKEPFFNYNFANLFFGFRGINEIKNATQIKGIEQIQTLGLDKIALDVDYSLFVNHDVEFFSPQIRDDLKILEKKYKSHFQRIDEDSLISEGDYKEEVNLRRAVRRFYLVYSLYHDKSELDQIYNQIYGANYSRYCDLSSKHQPRYMLRNLQAIVFQALYMKNTGSLPNETDSLPLTLRRQDEVFQNVMLVLGKVDEDKLEIIQEAETSDFEDNNERQGLYFKYLKNKDSNFRITLPMILYFENLINGAIESNNNPSLSHGISTLETLLLENFGDKVAMQDDECEIRVLINTINGQEYKNFSFVDKNLYTK